MFVSNGMSMAKVTKAFSYSFNMYHVSLSSVEVGTGRISNWISGDKYFKWDYFLYGFLLCKKYLFIWKNYFFDKAIKLVDGAIKPLQFQTTLKVLTKF